MTLIVDAARAAFNSSTTTISVKRLKPRFWPPFCDREPLFYTAHFQFYFYTNTLYNYYITFTQES